MLNHQLTTELINGLKSQRQDSIAKLCDDYAPAIYAYVLKIVAEQDKAESLLQQVFVKAWKTISAYDPGQHTFFVWILNIARNEAINSLCQHDLSAQQLFAPFATNDSQSTETASTHLSLLERTILTLRHCRKFGVAEIAAFLRLPSKLVQAKLEIASNKISLQQVGLFL